MADKTPRRFGWIKSPPDPRDFNLKCFIPKVEEEVLKEKYWDFPAASLDQGSTPHCVGFSMADFGINEPTITLYTNEDGHDFYYKCKVIDGNPDGEDGTTIRSAAKVLQDEGVIENYAFAPDIDSIVWWLLNRGPVIVGTVWTEYMMEPKENNFLDTGGYPIGGHGYIFNGVNTEENFLRGQNSWGPDWGENGMFYINIDDFVELFSWQGEALAAVEMEDHVEEKQCCLKSLWSGILSFIESILALFRE